MKNAETVFCFSFSSFAKPCATENSTDFCSFAVPELPKQNISGSQKKSSPLKVDQEKLKVNLKEDIGEIQEDNASDLTKKSFHKSDIWLEESDDSDNETHSEIKKKVRDKNASKTDIFAERQTVAEPQRIEDNSKKVKKKVAVTQESNFEIKSPDVLDGLNAGFTARARQEVLDGFDCCEKMSGIDESVENYEDLTGKTSKKKESFSKEDRFSGTSVKKTPRRCNVRSKDIRSFLSPKNEGVKELEYLQEIKNGSYGQQTSNCGTAESVDLLSSEGAPECSQRLRVKCVGSVQNDSGGSAVISSATLLILAEKVEVCEDVEGEIAGRKVGLFSAL